VSRRAVLLLVALAVASVALVARRQGPPATAASGPGSSPPAPAQRRAAPAPDPAAIRDVFRFVEPKPAVPRPRPTAPAVALATPTPEPFRLVGLVRRQGKLLAAFSLEGEVVLAGPGDDVAGVTLIEVGEEGVRIRRRDGSEGRLSLP
jgi:hypothetical protein